jgi:hypothetical protein
MEVSQGGMVLEVVESVWDFNLIAEVSDLLSVL